MIHCILLYLHVLFKLNNILTTSRLLKITKYNHNHVVVTNDNNLVLNIS